MNNYHKDTKLINNILVGTYTIYVLKQFMHIILHNNIIMYTK